VLSVVPFGAGGSFAPPVGDRDYHYGPGAQAHFNLQVVHRDVGRIGVNARLYDVTGDFVHEGWNFIEYLSAFAEVAVSAHHGVGVETTVVDRDEHFTGSPAAKQKVVQLSLYWTCLTDGAFAAFMRQPR
jgi:hypothetical protein